jgi:hypothetical protein
MPWTPEKGCIGKAAYTSKKDAKRMSRSVSQKNLRFGDTPTHVYRCPACGLYHYGHGEGRAA